VKYVGTCWLWVLWVRKNCSSESYFRFVEKVVDLKLMSLL